MNCSSTSPSKLLFQKYRALLAGSVVRNYLLGWNVVDEFVDQGLKPLALSQWMDYEAD